MTSVDDEQEACHADSFILWNLTSPCAIDAASSLSFLFLCTHILYVLTTEIRIAAFLPLVRIRRLAAPVAPPSPTVSDHPSPSELVPLAFTREEPQFASYIIIILLFVPVKDFVFGL
ncbi:hypothetical protein JVT61DRAFT_10010 [Boletus reticuloceps]|uniref:Uncharacterized protein n=1 Tax=Boletus reticuloceps TaxID=495285 RepID=A0A8I3ADJ3_9AGAM|nr:hypothetical protein JVT61DRAFT_10010 [Boletus reticuloceps]